MAVAFEAFKTVLSRYYSAICLKLVLSLSLITLFILYLFLYDSKKLMTVMNDPD